MPLEIKKRAEIFTTFTFKSGDCGFGHKGYFYSTAAGLCTSSNEGISLFLCKLHLSLRHTTVFVTQTMWVSFGETVLSSQPQSLGDRMSWRPWHKNLHGWEKRKRNRCLGNIRVILNIQTSASWPWIYQRHEWDTGRLGLNTFSGDNTRLI